MTFYLEQLRAVETEEPETLEISQSTKVVCLGALIPAQFRVNWIQELESMDDAEWAEARQFVKLAIDELTAGETTPPDPVPIWVQFGSLISEDNNVFVIQPLADGGDYYVFVHINHSGSAYVDENRYKISVEPDEDYVEPGGFGVFIYDRDGVELSIEDTPLIDYCNTDMGYFVVVSFTQTYLVTLTVKEVCP